MKKSEWTFRELVYRQTTVNFDEEITEDEARRRYDNAEYHWNNCFEDYDCVYSLESVY